MGCEIPASKREVVDREVRLIEGHAGFEFSPIFVYREDYSQYVPRGHYTRSEVLQRYFKALMWYGRLGFLLKNSDLLPAPNGLRTCIRTPTARRCWKKE